ncbi:helix-turn-helix DNA binding domain protein [Gordonia phage DumpsterDude]|uniref:Helix-turn-helix DNA binding domain protein n=1 Tax=Gordonia phage DumpsterDude TaxID=2713262 RepID=A0A6G8R0F0_9CAUD|nr:helix-turn-helix DNA binding domain protein [Gordonia phage DumpsterDude]QIN93651.1 helix-turn-helix DNA binding domain protein [Gordonia phage DumpsterDude]
MTRSALVADCLSDHHHDEDQHHCSDDAQSDVPAPQSTDTERHQKQRASDLTGATLGFRTLVCHAVSIGAPTDADTTPGTALGDASQRRPGPHPNPATADMAGGAAPDRSVDHRQTKPQCVTCQQRPARTRGKCPACYERERTRQKAYGRWESQHVDAQPVRDHVHALRESGVSNKRLRELTGVSKNTIQVLMTGRPERGHGPTKKMLRRTADRILAVPVPELAFTVASPGRIVPALGTTRRLQALVANGYSQRELCRRLGWEWQGNTTALFLGRADHVVARRAREVADLFTQLQLVPGTDMRARDRARSKGWPAPLDWDEDAIDDPNNHPEPFTTPRTVADDLDEFEYLLDAGENANTACTRLNATPAAMIKRYERASRPIPPALASAAHTARARREQVAS